MITIEEINTITQQFNIQDIESDYYSNSYSTYVNFFAQKKKLTAEDIIVGMGLVYSWMPTIPKNINFDLLDEAVPILNSIKNGAVIEKKEFDILKPLCNNSLVGASKLLHFINPNLYAIWDSKIYTFLYQEKAHKHRVENIDKSMAYLELIRQMATYTQLEKIITDVQTHFKPNPISNIRAIEWMMFTMK